MKPYFECEEGTIYCADCLDILPEFPDKSFDLCLTDPPYGIKEARRDNASRGLQRGGLNNNALGCSRDYPIESWDDKPPSQEEIDEIFRVSHNQIIFGANHFSNLLPASSCWLVWDKENGNNDFADCELAYTSFKKAVRKFRYRWHGMLQENMACKEQRYHRNQKPAGLFSQIINQFSPENTIIIDAYFGSGTTGVACVRMGRKFVGIDISEKYCEIAKNRIIAEKEKYGLFKGLA